MYPKEFFEGVYPHEELGRCFVVMPFAPEFEAVYKAIVEVVSGENIGFTCKRADELFGGGHIIEDILTEVARAEVVIADVSARNPNVFYELGIVHMIKDTERVFILTQSMDDVPFDIQQFRSIPYALDNLLSLQNQLIAAFSAVVKESFHLTGSSGESIESPRRLLGHDRWMYSLSLPELYVEPDFAKFLLKVTRTAINREPEVVFEDGVALTLGECFEIPGACWDLTLTRIQGGKATFRVGRGDASKTDGDRSALSGTQRKLLAAIAEAGSNGIYANRLPDTHPELDLDREAIVYRAKDLAANGYITIKPLTDLLYTVTDKGSAALA